MSEDVTRAAPGGWLRDAALGFHGKIPARGDFVRSGLPFTFTDPWDRWMEQMLTASRSALGDAWLPAWLEAPVWRFALTPGVCGPDAVIGLWMPSVDRIGRYYPLTLAAAALDLDIPAMIDRGGGFLAALERAGRDALELELAPDELAARLAAAAPASTGANHLPAPPRGGLWWTEGGPRVPAGVFASPGLPDEKIFFAMLASCSILSPALFPEEAR